MKRLLLLLTLLVPLSAWAVTVPFLWDAPPIDLSHGAATGYKIYKGTGATCAQVGPLTTLLATVGDVRTYSDGTVAAGETVCYEAAGINAAGEGPRTARITKVASLTPLSIAIATSPVPYTTGNDTVTITGDADSLIFDRGAPAANWPAAWPTGNLSTSFTKTSTGWTFPLCISCYPAPGNYLLTVTAIKAGVASTATLPLAISGLLPPPPAAGLTVVSASPQQIVMTAATKDCSRLVTSTKGSTATVLKRTVTCVK